MSCWILCRRGHANCQGCDMLSSAPSDCTVFQTASPAPRAQHCPGPAAALFIPFLCRRKNTQEALGAHNQIPQRNWCFGSNLGEDTLGAAWMPAKSISHSGLLQPEMFRPQRAGPALCGVGSCSPGSALPHTQHRLLTQPQGGVSSWAGALQDRKDLLLPQALIPLSVLQSNTQPGLRTTSTAGAGAGQGEKTQLGELGMLSLGKRRIQGEL